MAKTKSHANPIGVQKYLKGANYPARKEDLVMTARGNKAPREVLEALERLPGDHLGPRTPLQRPGSQTRSEHKN